MEPRKPVAPMESMDDATVLLHFNARHMPVAGMLEFRARDSDPGEILLRQYHTHVHFNGYDDNDPSRPVNHVHADPVL